MNRLRGFAARMRGKSRFRVPPLALAFLGSFGAFGVLIWALKPIERTPSILRASRALVSTSESATLVAVDVALLWRLFWSRASLAQRVAVF